MKRILLLDRSKTSVSSLFQSLDKLNKLNKLGRKYVIEFDTEIDIHLSRLKEVNLDSLLLIFWGIYADGDIIPFLKKKHATLNKKIILVTHDQTEEYLLQCFKYGVLGNITVDASESKVASIINLHCGISQEFNQNRHTNLEIKYESKKLFLQNKDIYDSDQIQVVIEYLLQSARPLISYDTYQGLEASLYEILFNAMEHGNLGIGSKKKKQLLSEKKYQKFLEKQIKINPLKIVVQSVLDQNHFFLKINDEGEGIKDSESPILVKNKPISEYTNEEKLNGLGTLIASHFFDEINFSSATVGNQCTLKKELLKD